MTRIVRPILVLCASLGLGTLLVRASAPAGDAQKPTPSSPAAVQHFETKVRPVLVDNCFKCHADTKPKGNLRLDSLAGMLEGGDQGPALVPGDPEKSLIIKAIRHVDRELKMPPTGKLSKEQIADVTLWVKMGAPWPGSDKGTTIVRKGEFRITDKDRAHWAFQPVKRPAPPAVKNNAWVTNPIDAFILAQLEAKGLAPNPPASKQELIRRVCYDLTGLPPTPQEVDAFLKDTSPKAYELLIDRLLSSPRYGEKWGRHWLDLVRFAETNSYERDNPKPHAWRYRDYVIRAFNQNKPYDEFIREQLAGDELSGGRKPPELELRGLTLPAPEASADAIIATGYYRLGIWDDEPSDPLQARYDGLDDIIATTGQVFLGLTFDCARCHDHKIDPIPQKDYYRLLSFFQNINHYRNGGPTDERAILPTLEAKQAYEQKLRELETKKDAVQGQLTAIEQDFRTLYDKEHKSVVRQPDLDDLGYRFYRDTWTKLPDFAALKPEEAGKLPRNLFDLSPRTRNEAFGFVFEGALIVPAAGKYTFYLDSDDGSRLFVNGKTILEYDGIHDLGKEKKASVELPKGRLPIKLQYFQNLFGMGLSVAWSGPGFERRLLSAPVGSERSAVQDFALLFKTEGPRLLGKERFGQHQKLKRELDALQKQKLPAEMALCVTETGSKAPETFVLIRGNPHVKGAKIDPAFPQILGGAIATIPVPPAGAKSTGRRTVLANWIASPHNRLTARVMVNRLWQHHFGRGIVRSSNDFGLQGTRPTDPELLDWLASEFVAQGWRMKSMHRVILQSSAYRMSSKANPKALAVDPANDLFWRFDMRRLGAEEIRDSILAVSGNLNLKMFGPGIYPEIPKEVMAGQSMPGRGWGKSTPEEQARRSVYVHIKRSLLLPIFDAFDVAETDRSTPLRFSSTQPTQALLMVNGAFLNKQAEIFAERLRREAGAEREKQVPLALSLATQRQPAAAEVQRGLKLIEALRTQDGATEEAALKYFCLMVLNLNEFVYVD